MDARLKPGIWPKCSQKVMADSRKRKCGNTIKLSKVTVKIIAALLLSKPFFSSSVLSWIKALAQVQLFKQASCFCFSFSLPVSVIIQLVNNDVYAGGIWTFGTIGIISKATRTLVINVDLMTWTNYSNKTMLDGQRWRVATCLESEKYC